MNRLQEFLEQHAPTDKQAIIDRNLTYDFIEIEEFVKLWHREPKKQNKKYNPHEHRLACRLEVFRGMVAEGKDMPFEDELGLLDGIVKE